MKRGPANHARRCQCVLCTAVDRRHKRKRAAQLDAFTPEPPPAPEPPARAALNRAAAREVRARLAKPQKRRGHYHAPPAPPDPKTPRLRELLRQGVPMAAALEQVETEWRNRA